MEPRRLMGRCVNVVAVLTRVMSLRGRFLGLDHNILEDAWKERTSTNKLPRIYDKRGLRSGSVPATKSPEMLVVPRG